MNIDFSRIMPTRGVEPVDPAKAVEADKIAENSAKPLFGESLIIKEKENFTLNDIGNIDMDEVEKELDRDDKLGKLFSSHLTWDPPAIPDFV